MDSTTNQQSQIVNFYKNKSIFITGASGFVGKVLVEKLLRTCSKINKIYVLLRSKKAEEEIEELCSNVNIVFHVAASGRPNTYTFTKAVAEHCVNENRGQLPVAIARPSIVTASFKEPFPGWIDSFNATDFQNSNNNEYSTTIENKNGLTRTLPIYNITSGDVNPTTWEEFLEYGREIAFSMPSEKM
ncbi:uncharacterized protein LOC144549710, partial [Carex rostrata]